MPPSTPPDSPRFPLLAHLDAQMAELQKHAPAALESFDPDDVHDARVATRRVSAALDLAKPILSKDDRKPLAAGLKRLRHQLGSLRDADVMLERLAGLTDDARHGAAARWLRTRVAAGVPDLRAAAAKDGSPTKALRRVADWPVVRHALGKAHEAVDCALADALHLQADAFAEQADRLAADLRAGPAGEAAADGGQPQDADDGGPAAAPRQDPHALRVAGKALRYTLELAAAHRADDAVASSALAKLLKRFKRMQDQLGDWHDRAVLADRALRETSAAALALHDAAAAGRVLDLARALVRRSARDLSAFAERWVEQGGGIAAEIRDLFPLTRDVSGAAGGKGEVSPEA